MPVKVNWRYGCWRIYSSSTLCEASEGIMGFFFTLNKILKFRFLMRCMHYFIAWLLFLFSCSNNICYNARYPMLGGG